MNVAILRSGLDAEDPYETIFAVVDATNLLFQHHHTEADIGVEMLQHYYLDYYAAQVRNGGHEQFFFNAPAHTWDHIEPALDRLGLPENVAIWREFRSVLDAVPTDDLRAFKDGSMSFQDGYKLLSGLDPLNDRFFAVVDDFTTAHAAWIRGRDDLEVVDDADAQAWAQRRAEQFPDLAERQRAAEEAAPSYFKQAKAYCAEHGLAFEAVTAGDYVERDGEQLIKWHFVTDVDVYSLLELPDGSVEVERVGSRS